MLSTMITYICLLLFASVHHYFPALYFAMISFVALADHFASRTRSKIVAISIHVIIGLLFTATFLFFADFAFGMGGIISLQMIVSFFCLIVFGFFHPSVGPSKEYRNRRWLSSWNIYD